MEREVQSSIYAAKSREFDLKRYLGKYILRQINAGKCKIDGGYGGTVDTDC
jgi:hypothetical protein